MPEPERCNYDECLNTVSPTPGTRCGGVLFGTRDDPGKGCGKFFCSRHLVGHAGPFYCQGCWDRGRRAHSTTATRSCPIPCMRPQMSCERCGAVPSVLYSWPGGRGAEHLCSPCVSPLCEWCGEKNATTSVGSRGDNWHLCDPCQDLPRFKRKRRKVPL